MEHRDQVGSDLLTEVLAVLRTGPAGLFTDVDGTISPIVQDPSEARVLPLAQRALARLARRLDVVGVVSGRPVADVRQMVGVAEALYVGNHGLEIWSKEGASVLPEVAKWAPRVGEALTALRQRLDLPGFVFENKVASATIHYRLAADHALAERNVREALADTPEVEGLRTEPGRKVVNLLPPLDLNKGTAVARLARDAGLQGVVYLGDDVTDTHAFLALADLRRQGIRTLAVGVVGAETPHDVRDLADAHVPSVDAVAELLHAVARALEGER